jgi:hypothetical protein
MSEQKMEHVNPTGDLLAEAARPADSVAVEAHRRGDGREAMSVENPWREFIENCINGDNYFRAREYMELLADLDRGYAAEMEVERLRSRLAEADALLREALPSVQSHIRKHRRSWEAAMKRGDEFHTRKHCEQMNKDLALESRIDAHLARKP